MKHVLLLFTAQFPFETGETFLETELPYLSAAFDEVKIISAGKGEAPTRELPGNVSFRQIDAHVGLWDKLNALRQRFNAAYLEERRIIRRKYKRSLSPGIIKTMLISLRQAKKYRQILSEELEKIPKTDKVVAYSYWCDDAALALAFERKANKRFKAISRIHRWDVYFEESAINYLPFRTFIADHLDKIYSISQDGIDYAEKVWKVERKNFALSRLGISNTVDPVQPSSGVFRLVSCSNMIPVKRVGLIADALEALGKVQLEWTHFGDGAEWNAILAKAEQLPFSVQVELKGRIPNKDIYRQYHDLAPDLFINVSSSEGVPVSIMEAMSFGIPVIATAVGGTPEIVNESNGYLLPADPSAEEVANAIRDFLALEREQRKAMRAAAYATWKEEYNAERNYTEFVKKLMKLV